MVSNHDPFLLQRAACGSCSPLHAALAAIVREGDPSVIARSRSLGQVFLTGTMFTRMVVSHL